MLSSYHNDKDDNGHGNATDADYGNENNYIFAAHS